jgi:hypothetical protein
LEEFAEYASLVVRGENMRAEHVTASVRAISLPLLAAGRGEVREQTPSGCRRWLQWLMCAAVPLCCWLETTAAAAQPGEYRLAVFAFESDELQDQFADRLAQQLRAALDARSDYALQDTRVSLVQLSLAQNCNTTQPACLASIAQSLGVDGFVFGKVTHEGGVPVAVLRRYDLWGQSVDRSALASFSSNAPKRQEFEKSSARALLDLLGPEPTGAHPLPELTAPASPRLERPGDLVPPETDLSASRVAGFALLGGAVLSTGLSVLSFIEVGRAERNRDYERYRLAVGARTTNVSDVCDEASAGRRYGLDAASFREVKNACSRGSTFEILQFVFIGGAVVSGGLAAYFLTSGGSSKERPAIGNNSWSLHPSIARKGFGLGARMKF